MSRKNLVYESLSSFDKFVVFLLFTSGFASFFAIDSNVTSTGYLYIFINAFIVFVSALYFVLAKNKNILLKIIIYLIFGLSSLLILSFLLFAFGTFILKFIGATICTAILYAVLGKMNIM